MKHQKIVFLTIGEPGYSRSWTYFNGARKLGIKVEFIKINSQNLLLQFRSLRKDLSNQFIYVVMSPSQYLVPYVWFFLGKKIVLDAGWSLFEGSVISRRNFGFLGFHAIKIYLIDLIASVMSKKIILESKLQRNFYSKLFLTSKSKCFVVYTGLDEDQFKYKKNVKIDKELQTKNKIVLFKGKYNKEAGLETLALASKILSKEKIQFWIFAPGMPRNIEFDRNVYINKKILSQIEMTSIQQKCDLALGQMAKHSRLNRTIPHKAFEFAYFSKPYLTAKNSGICEVFVEDSDISCFHAGDAESLAEKIKHLLSDKTLARNLADSFHRKYWTKTSQAALSKKFISICRTLR
jgi:glycosyltransferase involved in cell wall biosynthesis